MPKDSPQGEWLRLGDVLDRIAKSAGRRDGPREIRVALAISGGGATGAYQAGVLKAYLEAVSRCGEKERELLQPSIIVGTSAGALNAFLLLLDRLGLAEPAMQARAQEPYVATIWRAIGEENRGARFVVGRRRWLISLITRWAKNPAVLALLVAAVLAFLVATINPLLVGRLLDRSDLPILDAVGKLIVAHPRVARIAGGLALLLPILFILVRSRRALFDNAALRATLANAVRDHREGDEPHRILLRPARRFREEQVAQRVVKEWYDAPTATRPEFVLTATDQSIRWECLFSLVSAATYLKLVGEGWQVAQIGLAGARDRISYRPPDGSPEMERCAGVSDSLLFRCVVASTSIPGVFCSQRIPLVRVRDGQTIKHAFVDGGVLNNAPIHVAIDAGATHILSIELDPLLETRPLGVDTDAKTSEPRMIGNLIKTFEALLNMATSEDIARASSWNRWLYPHDGDQVKASGTEKKVAHIYRVAPEKRDVDTIEFDGHYPRPFDGPDPGLVDWMERGHSDAALRQLFWVATYEASPRENPPYE